MKIKKRKAEARRGEFVGFQGSDVGFLKVLDPQGMEGWVVEFVTEQMLKMYFKKQGQLIAKLLVLGCVVKDVFLICFIYLPNLGNDPI